MGRQPPASLRYTEAEIWWGGVTEVYNKAVRNIRDLVDVGASDSNLRGAIDAISNVVSVARESRSELAVISTDYENSQYDGEGLGEQDC